MIDRSPPTAVIAGLDPAMTAVGLVKDIKSDSGKLREATRG
jgi:hypothetical protein